MPTLEEEISRRRTFAIISHPDAGKTTLTEKFLLYGGAIAQAGEVKGKRAKAATSDWMEIEKQRGISVTSSVMQFQHNGFCINILDTPGHQDFSEDTYRTLMAADSAVMVIDGAKGVEPQTRKLFKVCALRHIPIFTFINKMDRETRDPLELCEEVERELGIDTYAVNWPIGCGKEFAGVYDREKQRILFFSGETRGKKVNSVAIKQDRCMYCGNCYTMCPALPISDGEGDGIALMVGGKVSNRISMPKFSKVVVAYIPNEPPRWNTLTSTIKHIVEVYSENANKYERLGDWAERIGWESFFELTGLEFTHHLIDDFRDPAYYTWRQSTQFKFSELALAAHGGEAHEAASAAEVTAEDKEIVINFLKDKMSRPGAKTKYYFKDFLELFPAKGTRDVKNVLSVLVSEESLEYWSSGSTTMYGLKGAGKQASSEGEN